MCLKKSFLETNTIIACDLGSNTLRIVEYDCKTNRRMRAYEKIVRTAKDLHKTGIISAQSQKEINDALKEASLLFDFKHTPTACVTTQAMRSASNASMILEHIKQEFGLDFKIISGEEEAYLASLAIEMALKREGLDASTYALFDLGGGSTEIMLSFQGKKESSSFPFGIISVAEKRLENPNILTESLMQIDPFLKRFENIPLHYKQLIATAGTPTTVAAFLQGMDYENYDYQKINGTRLHVNNFDRALIELETLPFSEAERFTGTNRRDLVLVGITLVKGIMQKLGFERCIVMDDGLREGVAIANCNTFTKSFI